MAAFKTSFKGQLLLDGGSLAGSFFHRSVVLICQHSAEGAFGLIINRRTDKQVGEALTADLPAKLKDEPLYIGGPVQPSGLCFLHSDALLLNANVISNVSVGQSLDELVELGGSFSPTQRLRIFAGYAGWSPGQLDDELNRGAWVTHPATAELVFHETPGELWRFILRQRGWEQRLLADGPDDISWN